jgi:hypothetical protein
MGRSYTTASYPSWFIELCNHHNSTHLTFVSAQFKQVLFLDLGAYILQAGPKGPRRESAARAPKRRLRRVRFSGYCTFGHNKIVYFYAVKLDSVWLFLIGSSLFTRTKPHPDRIDLWKYRLSVPEFWFIFMEFWHFTEPRSNPSRPE